MHIFDGFQILSAGHPGHLLDCLFSVTKNSSDDVIAHVHFVRIYNEGDLSKEQGGGASVSAILAKIQNFQVQSLSTVSM